MVDLLATTISRLAWTPRGIPWFHELLPADKIRFLHTDNLPVRGYMRLTNPSVSHRNPLPAELRSGMTSGGMLR